MHLCVCRGVEVGGGTKRLGRVWSEERHFPSLAGLPASD